MGHGFATEAAHVLIDLAFRATEIERLHVSCRASNGGSRRVIHKCGFQFSNMGMADSLAAGNVPVERYVLDRRTWIGLKLAVINKGSCVPNLIGSAAGPIKRGMK